MVVHNEELVSYVPKKETAKKLFQSSWYLTRSSCGTKERRDNEISQKKERKREKKTR